jgi:glutamate racemase
VIACNSASSAAYDLLTEYVQHDAKVINVIDPMVDLVNREYSHKKIGLIGTRRTVQSGIYSRKINASNQGISLHCLATPLLAPMIEEGYFNNKISHEIIEEYLRDPTLQGIEALILACTHYPLIKNEIASLYPGNLSILDSSEVVAQALRDYLHQANLISHTPPVDSFLVSDYTESFESSTRLFFRQTVHLERYPLWG